MGLKRLKIHILKYAACESLSVVLYRTPPLGGDGDDDTPFPQLNKNIRLCRLSGGYDVCEVGRQSCAQDSRLLDRAVSKKAGPFSVTLRCSICNGN